MSIHDNNMYFDDLLIGGIGSCTSDIYYDEELESSNILLITCIH